jgi:methionine-rich copper-binding protein CopC
MNNFLKTLSFILLSSGTLFLLTLFGLKIFFQKNMNNDLIILGPEKEEIISIPKDKGGLKVSNLDIEILNNKLALEINEKIRPLPTKPELLPIEIPETNKNDLKKSESNKNDKTITLKKSDDIKNSQTNNKKTIEITSNNEIKTGLYRVQFGSFRDLKKAKVAMDKMNKKYKNLLDKVNLEIFTFTNNDQLSFHRVWTTPLTKPDGLTLCNLFKKQNVLCILQVNK